MFPNCQTPELDTGDIDTSWSRDCRVPNNIAVAGPGKTVHRNRNRENKPEASNAWQANVLFADGEKKVFDFSDREETRVPASNGLPGRCLAWEHRRECAGKGAASESCTGDH